MKTSIGKHFLFACVLVAVTVLALREFDRIGIRLARNDAPEHADLIICLNGDYRIDKAAQLYHRGLADRILLTVHTNRDVLIRKGVPPEAVDLAPGVRTTFEEALAAREVVIRNPVSTVMVISDPYHLSRVRWSFEKAFQGMRTRLIFVASDLYWPGEKWCDYPFARYQVASELSKIIFYRAFYGVLDRKSVPDWVSEWKIRYIRFLRAVLMRK